MADSKGQATVMPISIVIISLMVRDRASITIVIIESCFGFRQACLQSIFVHSNGLVYVTHIPIVYISLMVANIKANITICIKKSYVFR